MSLKSSVSPRVIRVLSLISRLSEEEQSQLAQLLPPELIPIKVPEEALNKASIYFRAKAKVREKAPSLDDPFIGGLTYREYFALSDEEAEALWDKFAAEAPPLETMPVVEVQPDARIPARQKRRA